MRALWVSTRHALNGQARKSLSELYTSCPSLTTRSIASSVVERKVTRKKYDELPTTFTLPDGSQATPLEDWNGGLSAPPSVRRRRSKTLSHQTADVLYSEQAAVPSNVEIEKTGKARKRRVKCQSLLEAAGRRSQIEVIEQLPEETIGNLSVERKRSRKVHSAGSSQAAEETPLLESTTQLDTPSPTPRNQLATEILENLAKFPHCILLTRVGQFYESYFDQAAEVARLLNIKLTTRKWDKQRILMCGFPIMHLSKYLKVLVQENHRFVAMCEEFPRPLALGVRDGFDRRVVRVITPGTLIDEPFLNPFENNYLLAISTDSALDREGSQELKDSNMGLAWIDLSTGEFFSKSVTMGRVRDELACINPREVVVDEKLEPDTSHPLRILLSEEDTFVSFITPSNSTGTLPSSDDRVIPDDLLKDVVGTSSSAASTPKADLGSKDNAILWASSTYGQQETDAITLLTAFLQANLMEHMPGLPSPNHESTEARMQIDAHTIQALEIREGISEGGTRGSLLSVIKRTVTRGGTRLLVRWLCAPSTSLDEINARQSLVAFFHSRPHLGDDLLQALGNLEDATRIVQKFSLGRGAPSDLVAINLTIRGWSSIKARFEQERVMEVKERGFAASDSWASLQALLGRMNEFHELSGRIGMALDTEYADQRFQVNGEDPEATMESQPFGGEQADSRNVWRNEPNKYTIKPQFSPHLTTLHATMNKLLKQKDKLELHLQQAYDAPSLSLRSSPGLGMHVHLQRAKRDQAKLLQSDLFVSIAESGTTRCFFHQPWSTLGTQFLETTSAIYAAEKEAFDILRKEVIAQSSGLRRNARIVDELDVSLAFANLAREMNFTRPVLRDDNSYHVINGRHPAVELGLLAAGRVFAPNSVSLTPQSRLHVVTGPNMAGKSTLLRQTALIAILAQSGSFVPAEHASMGIVDKLFSRVGAKDDLFRDRSTFMVEMLETAEILERATPKSLVIMDEVGRGTTVKDGLAIAFATLHHLVSVNCCRALFATHFHELADMLGCSEDLKGRGTFKDVAFFCTDVDETADGHFAYSHRVRPGVNRDSHGLKVARLAGMPGPAIEIAQKALIWLSTADRETEFTRSATLRALGQSL